MKFNCDQCGTRYSIADEKVERKILRIRCKVCDYIMTVRGSDLRAHDSVGISVSLSGSAVLPADHVEWYAAPNNRQMGPLSLDDIIDAVKTREVRRDTLVWNSSMDNWVRAEAVDEFLPHFDGPDAFRSMPPPLPANLKPGRPEDEATLLMPRSLEPAKQDGDDSEDGLGEESISELSIDMLSDVSPNRTMGRDSTEQKDEQTKSTLGTTGLLERDTDVSPPTPSELDDSLTASSESIDPGSSDDQNAQRQSPVSPVETEVYPLSSEASSLPLEVTERMSSDGLLKNISVVDEVVEKPVDLPPEMRASTAEKQDESGDMGVKLNISNPATDSEFMFFGGGDAARPSPSVASVQTRKPADGPRISGLAIAAMMLLSSDAES